MFKYKVLHFTDLQLLKTIRDMYAEAYLKRTGDTRFYIPINCDEIAKEMQCDAELIFQRLNFHLNKQYAYKQNDNSNVYFFSLRLGEHKHCINYPYVCSILANMVDEKKELRFTQAIAAISIIISIVALFR